MESNNKRFRENIWCVKMNRFIPLADPCISEEEAKAVYEVVKSGWIRQGRIVEEFEKEFAKYLGVKHAIAVSSGTAALHVALASLGIGEGNEVIVPSFTCAPPVSATILVRAVPVFADIEPVTYNINSDSVRKLISDKTKAVIPINYAGHPAELKELQEIAESKGLYLINDAAEALGSMYNGKNIAQFGEIVVFSFSPNKTITTGEGGMIVTNDDEIAEKARIIRDYGQKERFHYVELGFNYHMTEMQAAVGLVQLKKLERFVERKRRNAKLLTKLLEELDDTIPPTELPNCKHCYMLYSVRVLKNRDKFSKLLKEKYGIQNRIYFPPVHKSPMIRKFKHRTDKLTVTEEVSPTILSLPSSPSLSEADVYYIFESVKNCLEEIT